MVTKRSNKPSRKAGKAQRGPVRARTGKAVRAQARAPSPKSTRKARIAVAARKATPAPKEAAVAKPARPLSRPVSVKVAARAVAAARAGAAKHRAPSYIPRSQLGDDWLLGSPVELPRQPNPAAHTPTRKPPKPRAPKPKAISHEQAVANLKALLESRKRKDRGGESLTSDAI